MLVRVTFNISKFNNACKEEKIAEFPLQSYEIEVQDEYHYNLSVSSLINTLTGWWESQDVKNKPLPPVEAPVEAS